MLDAEQYNHQTLFALLLKLILNPVILHHLSSAPMVGPSHHCSGFLSGLSISTLTSQQLVFHTEATVSLKNCTSDHITFLFKIFQWFPFAETETWSYSQSLQGPMWWAPQFSSNSPPLFSVPAVTVWVTASMPLLHGLCFCCTLCQCASPPNSHIARFHFIQVSPNVSSLETPYLITLTDTVPSLFPVHSSCLIF